MRYRWVGSAATLLATDYSGSVSLVLGSEKIVIETLVLKVDEDYIAMNDDDVRYYSIVAKKGLNSLVGATTRVLFGPLGHAVARAASGSPYFFDGKRKLVFIKLKNNKRLFVQVEEGNMRLIRSKNILPVEKINQDDERWISGILERVCGTTKKQNKAPSVLDRNTDEDPSEEDLL